MVFSAVPDPVFPVVVAEPFLCHPSSSFIITLCPLSLSQHVLYLRRSRCGWQLGHFAITASKEKLEGIPPLKGISHARTRTPSSSLISCRVLTRCYVASSLVLLCHPLSSCHVLPCGSTRQESCRCPDSVGVTPGTPQGFFSDLEEMGS